MVKEFVGKMRMIAAMFAFAAILVVALGEIKAEEKTLPQITVTGTVAVVSSKDADTGAATITAITITVADVGKYNVVLNDAAKKLAALNGKTVKALGSVETKGEGEDAQRWITVTKFEEVKTE